MPLIIPVRVKMGIHIVLLVMPILLVMQAHRHFIVELATQKGICFGVNIVNPDGLLLCTCRNHHDKYMYNYGKKACF